MKKLLIVILFFSTSNARSNKEGLKLKRSPPKDKLITVEGSPKVNKGIKEKPLLETFILPLKWYSLNEESFCEKKTLNEKSNTRIKKFFKYFF